MDCIWMGIVKELICNRNFDCENCELDKVFRNLAVIKNETVICPVKNYSELSDKLAQKIQSEIFDESLYYLKNQLVLKNIFGNVYYLGINPILFHFLDDFDFVKHSDTNEIKKGQQVFSIEGKWGIKKFISPFDFTIIEKINFSRFRLQKWYAIVLVENIDEDKIQFAKDEWQIEKNKTLSAINECKTGRPQIGQSMLDGGQKVQFLHQYFGNKKFIDLLNKTFV